MVFVILGGVADWNSMRQGCRLEASTLFTLFTRIFVAISSSAMKWVLFLTFLAPMALFARFSSFGRFGLFVSFEPFTSF